MKVPDDLKADSGLKTHVRDAIRPHLDFIAACKADGISEAAIHRHLLKKGHKVGSRSGFGAALKYLLREEQSACAPGAITDRSSLSALPVQPASPNPAAAADAGAAIAAETSLPVHSPAKTSFGDDRHGFAWGTA